MSLLSEGSALNFIWSWYNWYIYLLTSGSSLYSLLSTNLSASILSKLFLVSLSFDMYLLWLELISIVYFLMVALYMKSSSSKNWSLSVFDYFRPFSLCPLISLFNDDIPWMISGESNSIDEANCYNESILIRSKEIGKPPPPFIFKYIY